MGCLMQMSKLNQRGVIHLLLPLILLILLGGIIAGVYLVTQGNPLKLFSRATVSGPISPQTSFTLRPFTGPREGSSIGMEIPVVVEVRSDIDSANLFVAKINFDKNLLSVTSIKGGTEDWPSFITNWVEQFSDNATGQISLVGGVAAPGYQTNVNQPTFTSANGMATIFFKAKARGVANITFTGDSAIYRNLDNLNILGSKNNATLTIVDQVTPSAPIPACTNTKGSGDGNGDGKVNLIDLSILLADFNKTSGFRKGIDLNGDCKINTLDFSLMRNLLIQNGVIKG